MLPDNPAGGTDSALQGSNPPMRAFAGFQPLGPDVVLDTLAQYWLVLLAEILIAALLVRGRTPKSASSSTPRRFPSSLLSVPLLLWCWTARPAWIIGCGLTGSSEPERDVWLHLYQAGFALSVLLGIRTVLLTLLRRPAWSAGLAGLNRTSTEVALLSTLLLIFVAIWFAT